LVISKDVQAFIGEKFVRRENGRDFAVGISAIKKIGEHGDVDAPLLFVHARNEQSLFLIMPFLEKAAEVRAV
jgi:thymidine phosphorylase